MALDPMIARGGGGIDVSNTLAQIEGLRQRDRSLDIADQRNALYAQDNQQAMVAAQQQQQLVSKWAEISQVELAPPEVQAQWLQQQAQSPDFAKTPFANLPPEQAIPMMKAGLAARLGKEQKQSQSPSLPGEIQRYEYGLKNPDFRQYEDRNRPQAGGGGSEGGNVNWQRSTKTLPDGTVQDVAFNPRTLEERPLGEPKPQAAAKPMSPKDANTARIKITQVKVARRQLKDAQAKYAALKDTLSAGPGGNLIPSPKGKAYDAAIDTMRSSISALTRVPGIGAMSDFETRLDQAKFPSRGNYESVGEQQLQALADQLDTIESSYQEMLGQPASAAASPTKSAPAPGDNVKGYIFIGGDPAVRKNWVKSQ